MIKKKTRQDASPKMKIKNGDTVKVISGAYKGKTGEVIAVDRVNERVTIKGVNMRKDTMPKTQENPRGGIQEVEAPIHVSNVLFVGKDGKTTRIGRRVEGAGKDKKIVRYEKRSGEIIK